ncbi:MAG: hypothetical protein AB8H80_17570 [Planctomycetota bacterium]
MATQHDISGAWRGSYTQDGGQHGIRMDVAQRGQSFVGQMHDDDTLLSGKVDVTLVDEAGSSLGVVGCDTLGLLPELSIVEGEVEGDRVTLSKRYQGTHSVTLWNDEGEGVKQELPQHVVLYEGLLDESGQRLSGRWRIPRPTAEAEPDDDVVASMDGSFELLRQSSRQ